MNRRNVDYQLTCEQWTLKKRLNEHKRESSPVAQHHGEHKHRPQRNYDLGQGQKMA